MPKQILPTEEEFRNFFSELEHAYRCTRLSASDVIAELSNLPRNPSAGWKRGKKGIETCYAYRRPDVPVRVVVWTTYVAAERAARTEDAGWVLLVDERFPKVPCLFSFPVHRTKHFLKTIRQ